MNGLEIKNKIDEDNQKIAKLATPEFFQLNNSVYELMKEISYLQGICEHEFDENGVCIFCGKEQEEE